MNRAPISEFELLLRRLHASSVLEGRDAQGWSTNEITAIEEHYGLRLPVGYRRFVEVLGHFSGLLFRHDHHEVGHADVMCMTDEVREDRPGELPRDALVIKGRLGEQFYFMRCGQTEPDPQVYYIGYEETRVAFPSITAWLTSEFDEFLAAWNSGYFADGHRGTQ